MAHVVAATGNSRRSLQWTFTVTAVLLNIFLRISATELKIVHPANLAIKTFEDAQPFTFICQVPALLGTLILNIGEFEPIVVPLPCASPLICIHDEAKNQVSISIVELSIGTHSAQIVHKMSDSMIKHSETILFDIAPARNRLQAALPTPTQHRTSPLRMSYCAKNSIQVRSIAIISSLFSSTNGQSIFLLNLASALARKRIYFKNGISKNLRLKKRGMNYNVRLHSYLQNLFQYKIL